MFRGKERTGHGQVTNKTRSATAKESTFVGDPNTSILVTLWLFASPTLLVMPVRSS